MSVQLSDRGTPPYVPAIGAEIPEGSAAQLIELGRAAQQAGDWDQAFSMYEAGLERLRPGEDVLRCILLRAIGKLHLDRGDRDLAAERFQAALSVAEPAGLLEHVAAAMNALAAVEQSRGQLDAAEGYYRQSRRIALQIGDERRAAMADQNLGVLANIRGGYAMAIMCYRSALERYRRLGEEKAASWTLNNLGMLHVDREDFTEAERCFAEALELAAVTRDVNVSATVELNTAELHLRRGRYDEARKACDRALTTFARLKSKPGQGEAYKMLGVLYRQTERPHLAEIHFGLSLNMSDAAGDLLLKAEVLREWALVHLEERRHREAVKLLNQAHRLFGAIGAKRDMSDITRRMERLHESVVEAVTMWGGAAIESKDPYTAGHSNRVAQYACALAEALGMDAMEIDVIRIGALVHDVGKTVIPAEVLTKPGKLDDDEWALMKQHPVIGEEIVGGLDFPYDISAMVRGHHEHWDGRGYPDQLKGEEIPLAARILCIADVYDALTSSRSYRRAFSHAEAMRIMQDESGTTFDPALVAKFAAIVEGAM